MIFFFRAVFGLCLVCLWFFGCFVLVACPYTVTAQWIMYRSFFSSTFGAHCQYEDVAIALIR